MDPEVRQFVIGQLLVIVIPVGTPVCNLDQHAAMEKKSLREGIRRLATDVVRQGIRCQAANNEHDNNQNRNEHS